MQGRQNLSSAQGWSLKKRPHKLGFILNFETQCQRHKKEKGALSALPGPSEPLAFLLTPLSQGIKRSSKFTKHASLCASEKVYFVFIQLIVLKRWVSRQYAARNESQNEFGSQVCFHFVYCHQIWRVTKKITKNDILPLINDPTFNHPV